MRHQYKVQLFWSGRDATLARQGESLWTFTSLLARLHPLLGALAPVTREGELLPPLSDAREAAALLERNEVAWATGEQQHTSRKVVLALDRADDAPVECTLVVGMPRPVIEELWMPERLEVLVRDDADPELVRPDVLLQILYAGVQAFAPDWGYVGTTAHPTPPTPLYSDGRPVTGWMTYLSHAYPAHATVLQNPAMFYVIDQRGHIVVAHPELFDAGVRAHRDAVATVRDALAAAGVFGAPQAQGAR